MRKIIPILALSAVGAFGGSVAADDDYPPKHDPSGGATPRTGTDGGTGRLPATGSDTMELLPIAGGLVLVGAGLAGVAWYRRKPATT